MRADVAAGPAFSARTRTILGVLLLLAALSVLLPGAIWRSSDPEEVAEEYLDALVSGDLEALRPHLAPGDGALDVALAPPVLAATSGRVEAYTIDAVAISGANALVTATLGNGSTTARTTLTLRARIEGAFAPVRWELVPVELPVLDLAPFTGRRLVAEFTEAPAEVGAPAVSHRVTVDFGAFVGYRDGGYEVDRWNVIA